MLTFFMPKSHFSQHLPLQGDGGLIMTFLALCTAHISFRYTSALA